MNIYLFILGTVIFFLGIFTYSYGITEEERYLFGAVENVEIKYPYRDFSLPLILIGAVIMMVSAIAGNQNKARI